MSEYDGIVCLDTEQLRPRMAACYLVRGGDEYAFVDCGTGRSVPGLLAELDRRGIAREQVRWVLPTHVHLDHAGGAGALLRALPRARVAAHPRAARHLVDPAKLVAGAAAVYGAHNMEGLYGEIAPVDESRVVVADEGFTLMLGDRELRFVDAPGHARHHYAIWDERSRGWFTGDVFGITYPDVAGHVLPTTTPVQFEPEAWQATLERLMSAGPRWAYVTHYGRVGDLPARAERLRRGLSDYQAIARKHAAAPQRHAAIKAALADWSLMDLARIEWTGSEQRARSLLDNDWTLNAQGLEVWLDRSA